MEHPTFEQLVAELSKFDRKPCCHFASLPLYGFSGSMSVSFKKDITFYCEIDKDFYDDGFEHIYSVNLGFVDTDGNYVDYEILKEKYNSEVQSNVMCEIVGDYCVFEIQNIRFSFYE